MGSGHRMKFIKPAGLLGLVLLAHALLLSLLEAQWREAQVLAPMADPVFLRVLVPQPVLPKPARAPAAPAKAQPTATIEDAGAVPADTRVAEPAQAAASEAGPVAAAATPIAPESAPTQEPPVRDATFAVAAAGDSKAAADSWPVDTRVSYRMRGFYRGDLYGSAKVQWQREQDRYQVQLDMRMALLFHVSMTSQGVVNAAGLVPKAYEERFLAVRRGLVFEGDQVRLLNGRTVAQPPGVQDTASQFVELSHRFSTGRQTLAVGSVVEVWLARPNAVDLWTYDVTEEVPLLTPELGTVQAFHLKPRPIANPRGDIVAELWLAPSLQYLPVRVRIALGGENHVDLMVETIEQGAAPEAGPGISGKR